MSKAKLALASAAAILAAVTILGALELRAHQQLDSLRTHALQTDEPGYRPDCFQPDACRDKKYARRLLMVAEKRASVDQAAYGFCTETTWIERTSQDAALILVDCKAATQRRMARDLE